MTKRKSVKKIAVQKNDDASFVIEQVLDAKNDDVIVSLPKGSRFSESGSNFSLLKKQADLLDKNLRIESVDDDALAMAEKAGIEAENPFFGRMQKKQFSDIVLNPSSKKVKASTQGKEVHSVQVRDIDDGRSSEEEEEFIEELKEEMGSDIDDAQAAHIFHHHHKVEGEASDMEGDQEVVADDEAENDVIEPDEPVYNPAPVYEEEPRVRHFKRKKGLSLKSKIIGVVIILLLVAGGYFAVTRLPRADIVLSTNKETWSFEDSVIASKDVASIDLKKAVIPAEVFSQKVNRSFQFEANGKEFIERKAVGKLVIYNAFNSEPQALVATTRFATPDGKIFRIVSDVTVPGAKIENGKIVPSSIEVDIVADEAGEEYNIGPVKKLTVPGFSGTPRYNGFYGEIPGATSGGFVGDSVVATEKDRENALAEARSAIESAANTMLGSKIPEGFSTLKDASGFAIVKERVEDRADSNGMFSVFIEAEIYQLAFKEEDVQDLLQEMAISELGAEYEVSSDKIDFNRVTPSFEDGTLILDVAYEAMLRQKIDVGQFKTDVAGEKQSALEEVVSGLPGISKADVSLWPFWVSRVPKNLDRIGVEID